MSAETAAVLDRAADIVEKNGLHKGTFASGALIGGGAFTDKCCCARGAINMAANGNNPWETSEAGELAHDALCKYLGISGRVDQSVADWNDDEDRTADEVLAALRGAAQAERETGS